jgi:RimJ/RimL family protein N-acetyltransferase
MGDGEKVVRVELRELAEEDLPVFFEQQQDPGALHMAAFTAKDPVDREAFSAHWARIRADRSVLTRTIVVDGQVAGSVASYVDPELGAPEVTYWLGREFWGKGIATMALSEFLKEQTARPIYGRAAKDNTGSIRVLESVGLRLPVMAGASRTRVGRRLRKLYWC